MSADIVPINRLGKIPIRHIEGNVRYNVRMADEMTYGLTFDTRRLTLGEALEALFEEQKYDIESLVDVRFDCAVAR